MKALSPNTVVGGVRASVRGFGDSIQTIASPWHLEELRRGPSQEPAGSGGRKAKGKLGEERAGEKTSWGHVCLEEEEEERKRRERKEREGRWGRQGGREGEGGQQPEEPMGRWVR